MELYKKYRPKRYQDLIGQDVVARALEQMSKKRKYAHTILLSGPTGCGKTTIARIIGAELGCPPTIKGRTNPDFREINAANFKGIDMVREISQQMGYAAMTGKCRIYLIDEAHQLTTQAQDALLKMLEDTPTHVYFILCTTDSMKLKPTIRSRSSLLAVKLLNDKDMRTLVMKVVALEKRDISKDVVDAIIENADGSARKGLVLLESVLHLEEEDDQLSVVQSPQIEVQAIEIARALINPKAQWSMVAKLLKTVDEEPEAIRHLILAYATSILLGNSAKLHPRVALILEFFSENFYDSKKAGLALACWNVLNA